MNDLDRIAEAAGNRQPVYRRPAPEEPAAYSRTVVYVQAPAGRSVQTIEKTGKGWKSAMLLGGLMLAAGVFGLVAIVSTSEPTPLQRGTPEHTARVVGFALSLVSTVCGLALWLFARVGAWWCHG